MDRHLYEGGTVFSYGKATDDELDRLRERNKKLNAPLMTGAGHNRKNLNTDTARDAYDIMLFVSTVFIDWAQDKKVARLPAWDMTKLLNRVQKMYRETIFKVDSNRGVSLRNAIMDIFVDGIHWNLNKDGNFLRHNYAGQKNNEFNLGIQAYLDDAGW